VITPEAFVEGDPNTYAVFNGSHTHAYDPVTPAATVHARSEQVAFLMQSVGAPLRHGALRVRSSDPAACAVSLSGPVLALKLIGRQARRLFVNVDCIASRETWVTVSISIEVEVDAAGPARTISFGFKKRCTGDAPVPGLDVTLGPLAGASDESRESVGTIIRNGETRTAYLPDGPSARVTYDTADVHVHITTANTSYASEHAFGPPTVTCSEKWCRVLLSGPAANGGVSRSAGPELLVLKFDCSGSGTAQATFSLPLLNRTEPLRFALLKECRAGAIPGFDVTLSSYEPGVRASYALKNGAATPGYHAVGDGAGLAVVREAQSHVSFYLQMSNFHTLQFEPPVVRSSGPFCLVNVAGDASTGGWVDDISSHLKISFNCIDSGTATITVSVPLALDEQRVNATFAFRKECRWTSTPGFDVALGAWVHQDGPGADGDGAFAVRNGAATALFAPLGPKAVVAPRQYSSLFYLQMSIDEEQVFDWPKAESSDPGTARATLAGPASKGGLAKPGGARASDGLGLALVVKYDCLKTGSALITVTIPLGPWNEATFAFHKARGATQRNARRRAAPARTLRAYPDSLRPTDARHCSCLPSCLVVPRSGVRGRRNSGAGRRSRRLGAWRPPLVCGQEWGAHRALRPERARRDHPRGHAVVHLLPEQLWRLATHGAGACRRGLEPSGDGCSFGRRDDARPARAQR
jgi:hypothetical protein